MDGVTVCHYLRLPENVSPSFSKFGFASDRRHRRPFLESTDNLGGVESEAGIFSPAV